MPSAAVSSPTVGAARRVRAVRVPGHLNNAQLVTLLFERRNGATPSEADTGEASSDEWRRQSAASTPPTAAATVPAAAAASVPGSVRYPLNRQLVVFVVRDVARLCCYMPEHVRALIAADEDDELRTVAPSVGAVLLRELIVASKSMARQSLTMDTRTRRIYLLEQYVPGADNASLSAAVLAASESFRGLQERSWFTSGENPLQRLRLTYPIQPLQQSELVLSGGFVRGIARCGAVATSRAADCTTGRRTLTRAHQSPAHATQAERLCCLLCGATDYHSPSELLCCVVRQIQACVLSPRSCRFITLPQRALTGSVPRGDEEQQQTEDGPSSAPSSFGAFEPSQYDPATTLVLYPSPSAVALSDPSLAALLPHIDKVVVIESTWQKGGAVYAQPSLGLHRLRAVRLSEYESTYWRYQELGRHALCTLEAIYHLCREWLAIEQQRGGTTRRDAMHGTQLDDLLYLYAAQHSRLQTRYQQTQQNEQGKEGKEAAGEAEAGAEAARERDSREGVSVKAAAALSAGSSSCDGETAPSSKRTLKKKPPPRAWKPM